MEAAGQNGIPCAFIVGKDQKIEWIGHPMSMDKALTEVVEDKWDRDAFAKEFAESQKMDLLMAKIMRSARGGKTEEALELIDKALAETESPQAKAQLTGMKAQVKISPVMAMVQRGDTEEAMAELDKLIEGEEDTAMKQQFAGFRVQILMQGVAKLMQSGKTEEAMEELDKLIAAEKNADIKQQMEMTRVNLLMRDTKNPKFAEAVMSFYAASKDNPNLINDVTWGLYEKFADGELKDKDLLKASRAAAEQAAAAADPAMKAAILDTAAHYQFLDGDIKAALKTQTEASKLAEGPMKEGIDAFLEEIKEKAGK
jgi:tetratricopeptide (TPR) repeat protein